MLDYLIDLIGRLGHWGYVVMFAGAALESAAFLGVIVPGESLVLVAGFFAAQGLLDLDALIAVIALGATLGDSIGYEMGRRLGNPALLRYGSRFGLTQVRIEKTEDFFARHGGKAVFLGRFVGFARALVPFLAGTSQMRYRQFLPYNALGAILWSIAVTLLGYFLGASWRLAAGWIGRASAILAVVILFAIGLTWMWRWAVRHEDTLRQCWATLLVHPRMVMLRQRFARQIAFVEARLSPHSFLGLQLTLGALVLIGASWVFGAIAEDVMTGDPLTKVDAQVAIWLHEHGTPFLTRLMLIVTHLHGTIAISFFMAITALFLLWKRERFWLMALIVAVPGGMLLNVLMKHAFQRTRPTFDDSLLTLTTYSFPSGHVAGSTLFYGFLVALLVSKSDIWRRRVLIVLSAFAMIVLVAFSRMYLGVHYLSDVLAAFVEGIAWLALSLTGMHTFQRHRVERSAKTSERNKER